MKVKDDLNKIENINKIIAWGVRICIICLASIFIVGQIISKNTTLINNEVFDFSSGWTIEETGAVVDLPYDYNSKMGDIVTITHELPDNLKGGYIIAFYTIGDTDVYINGQLRQTFRCKNKPLPGKYTKDVWIPLDVDERDNGKELKIVRFDAEQRNGNIKKIYYGTQVGIANTLVMEYAAPAVLMLFLLVFTLFSLGICFTMQRKIQREIPIRTLLYGILLICFWIIFDSPLYQFVFSNYYIDGCLSYMTGMIAPYFFCRYLDEVQNYRYRHHYMFTNIIIILNYSCFTALHFLEIASFRETQPIMNGVLALVALAAFGAIVYDIKLGYSPEYRFTSIGYQGFGFFSVIGLLVINITYLPEVWSGLCICVGLYLLWIFASVQTVVDVSSQIRESRQAIEASELKSNFLANMSHEIRTPINAVLGLDEMIIRESEDDTIRNYAIDIRSSGSQLLSLVNDILDISKIESGKFQITPFDFDIANLLVDVNNMIATKAASKGLKFDIEIDESMPSIVHGDEVRIKQCVVNILNNAVKYTEKGSVLFRIDYQELEDDYVSLRFVVKDTGIGMREEDLERLYNPYERIDETRNAKIEGTGLGMAITQQLITMMDSKLEVESTYGEGSIFAFAVNLKCIDKTPLGSFDAAYQRLRQSQEERDSFIAKDAKILYVDDMSVNLTVFTGLLKHTQMQITTCMSGKAALKLSRENEFDLIFVDHMMPDMDGVETMYHLHYDEDSKNRATPIIIATANAVAGSREKYIREGFTDYLSKPIEPNKLESLIIRYLPEGMVEMVKGEKAESSEETLEVLERIKESRNFDVEEGIKASGSADLYVAALKDFYIASEERCSKIREFFENEDIHSYMIEVHALKSSARLIGSMRLSTKATILEEAARSMDLIPIEMETEDLLQCYGSVKRELDDLFHSSEPKQTIASDQLDALFASMLEAIENFDYDLASGIMDELAKYELDERDSEVYTTLSKQMVEVDFMGLEETLKNRRENHE